MNSKLTFSRFVTFLQIALVTCVLTLNTQAAGEIDPTFNPALVELRSGSSGVYNQVQRLAVQPDGKVLVGGVFRTAGKFAHDAITRLNADGTVDATFNPPTLSSSSLGFDYGGLVSAIAIQPDGTILVGGGFNLVDGVVRLSLIRLNSDGTLDTSFNSGGTGFTGGGGVTDIEVSADNKITFVGNFTLNNSTITRKTVARVFADGTLDASFNPPTTITNNTFVRRLELLPDGKTLIAGHRTEGGVVYRLNNDGSIDTTFATVITTGPSGGSTVAVRDIRVLPDGKFLAGGGFTLVNGFPLKGLARFNADGSVDTTFNISGAGADASIEDIEIAPGGKIFVSGLFSTYDGNARKTVALLDANGNLDNSLVYSGVRFQAADAVILPDGKILLGRDLRDGGEPPSLIRLSADGSVDASFSVLLGFYGRSNVVFAQADGKVLVGGFFTHADSRPSGNLVRFNANGTLDTSFMPPSLTGTFGEVLGLDVRASDGKILVSYAAGVIRLNPNGTPDVGIPVGGSYDAKFLPGGGMITAGPGGLPRLRKTTEAGAYIPSFDVPANDLIKRILIQPDGKFVVVGNFTQIAGVTRGRIARINADGTLDTTFNPLGGANNIIFDAVLQADGKIIIGGGFSAVNFNTGYKYLARLNTDGSLDTTFHPIIEGGVQSLKIQPSGKIIVGGAMYLINGSPRGGIARLNSDGTLDDAFNPAASANNSVLSIDVQTDGKIVIGGTFTHVNNIDRLGVARLLDTVTARTRFDFDGDGRADIATFRPSNGFWYELRSQTSQFYAQQFGQSGDLIAPADYDGDGKTDIAVFRSGSFAYFYIFQSSSNTFRYEQFGQTGDVPLPGDWDGDGKADAAVYRGSESLSAPSYFYYRPSSQPSVSYNTISIGGFGARAVYGDFDGDGRLDAAEWYQSNGQWSVKRSSDNQFIPTVTFGQAGDIPVPADYDGDGITNIAVFRPSTGYWYTSTNPENNYGAIPFGQPGDIPVPADYDGDGKADIAVFRPSNGAWYLLRSTQGFTGVAFGVAEDKPIPGAFIR